MTYSIEHHTGEFQTYKAGGTITVGELVALDTAYTIITATNATTNVVGIADESATTGNDIRVASGYLIAYIETSGAVSAGATLECTAGGQVDDSTAGACQTIGIAVDEATGAGWIRAIFNFPLAR